MNCFKRTSFVAGWINSCLLECLLLPLLLFAIRGLLARSVLTAQAASPTFSHVYAALVSVVNTKFPQTGELIAKRLIIQFKKSFRRNNKSLCLSTVRFIAHLVNQQVIN